MLLALAEVAQEVVTVHQVVAVELQLNGLHLD
jgi:hypothetical protein